MRSGESVHDRARGRWRHLLMALAPEAVNDPRFFKRQNMPCPMCGGVDRFRWTDAGGDGVWVCNACGGGTGVDLVMRLHGLDFKGALELIDPELPNARVYVPKATARQFDGSAEWGRGHRLAAGDLVTRYLAGRGIELGAKLPTQLRFRADARTQDGRRLPAMMAQFVSPCLSWTTVHFTFLTEDGANVRDERGKSLRKFHPGTIPKGGAVRLCPSAETMGVAEGIETALSAMAMFDVPVWAVLSTNGMAEWQPPEHVRHVIIFADNDRKYGGQHAAYALAYRLSVDRRSKVESVEVRAPEDPGMDWNDVHRSVVLEAAE